MNKHIKIYGKLSKRILLFGRMLEKMPSREKAQKRLDSIVQDIAAVHNGAYVGNPSYNKLVETLQRTLEIQFSDDPMTIVPVEDITIRELADYTSSWKETIEVLKKEKTGDIGRPCLTKGEIGGYLTINGRPFICPNNEILKKVNDRYQANKYEMKPTLKKRMIARVEYMEVPIPGLSKEMGIVTALEWVNH